MRDFDIPIRGEFTTVRYATVRDADLLAGWHADPEVARFWDDKTYTREEILARLARPQIAAFVVEVESQAVGFLQASFAGEDDVAALDMFLIPSARGRGLGPDAAHALTRQLLMAGHARVTVDPYQSNQRAIRAWSKAGFRPLEQRQPDHEHTAAWLLMAADSATAR